MELLAIPLSHQKTVVRRLVIAIRLGYQITVAKSAVMRKLLGVIVVLALSTPAFPVGMGGINVVSALGQPLNADIGLLSLNKTQKASLVARLASPDIYKGAGLEYPYGKKFTFQIESRANGEPYLKVSSEQPINDPFVSLLVELTWSSGKLLREYVFLLDPPGYVAEQPAPAEVQAVAPMTTVEEADLKLSPLQEMGEPTKESESPRPPRASEDEKIASAPAARAPEKKPAASIATGNITVTRGDTLTRIAAQNKSTDVSLEQMLVALYRANAEQFDGNNMNRIRAGKILRLPDQSELMDVAQSDAKKEIRAHVADWNIYRQKLASAAAIASRSQDAQQVATGKITSSVADKAPVAKESAKEVLKLSKGEAPGDLAAAGKSASAEDKKDAAQEDAIAKAKASSEDQKRAALLEKNLNDVQRLAKLKAEAAGEVKPKPVAKPEPKVVEAPSLLDQLLDEPLYLVGVAAIVLALVGLGLMLRRRKHAFTPEAGAITGRMASPAMPSPDNGDLTFVAAEHGEAAPADEVDPISEADLFLNFGRDTQAEDILKEALRNTPNNHQVHLRLLGIYANRKDASSFAAIASQLQDSGDEAAWQQAAAMGRKLEPNNPMYSDGEMLEDADSATLQATALEAAPEVVSGGTSEAPEVDFDLGLPAEKSAASPEQEFLADTESTTVSADKDATKMAEMDFDVSAAHSPSVASTGMDFDITSTHPPMPAATGQTEQGTSPEIEDLIFDVTSTFPVPTAQPEPAKPAEVAQADGGIEFTLDFPVEDAAAKPAAAAPLSDTGLAGISLNLDDAAKPNAPAPEAKDEHWHEVATKLDLAKAYQEMGDAFGAREILDEVLREGDGRQREAAQVLLDQLG